MSHYLLWEIVRPWSVAMLRLGPADKIWQAVLTLHSCFVQEVAHTPVLDGIAGWYRLAATFACAACLQLATKLACILAFALCVCCPAAAGLNGLMDPVEPGLACGSDTAHMSLFGYDPRLWVIEILCL